MCSSEGHLEIDPESQVTLVGCQDDEDGQVLIIVSTKHLFKSGVYRQIFLKLPPSCGDSTMVRICGKSLNSDFFD